MTDLRQTKRVKRNQKSLAQAQSARKSYRIPKDVGASGDFHEGCVDVNEATEGAANVNAQPTEESLSIDNEALDALSEEVWDAKAGQGTNLGAFACLECGLSFRLVNSYFVSFFDFLMYLLIL